MAFYQPPVFRTIVDVTASTLAPGIADSGTTYVLDRAAGQAVTLPAIDAGEIGTHYNFILKTTITSNSTTIKVPSAAETMTGTAFVRSDDAGAPALAYRATTTSDTITFNGTTTGGLSGDIVQLTALSTTLWQVLIFSCATGTEATPFSATVS